MKQSTPYEIGIVVSFVPILISKFVDGAYVMYLLTVALILFAVMMFLMPTQTNADLVKYMRMVYGGLMCGMVAEHLSSPWNLILSVTGFIIIIYVFYNRHKNSIRKVGHLE